ncbi:beta-N-acetylhexosaminidase [Lacimicrobium sp. SS2-24]|uniref:beta-N-acetylhexosaminidase n=1 Tax=Lacimicrobium sp. SS2-24 TaxID=2005569 RepID=UPI000B4ACBDE|nr:beta-N-acetylhexosaminidase [Lacimicrobium sp. SS2-24]
MGPVMLDLADGQLSAEEKELLAHPLTGGVILFSHNFDDPVQLEELVRDIRAFAPGPVLIAVDHEGGRVQRFRQGFSAIPAMGALLEKANGDLNQAAQWAEQFVWLMAAEVLAMDIDISFAPVLDVRGISEVIGDRSFAPAPEQVSMLAARAMQGMRQAGMKTTGKHFPGHGSVREDSHIAMPVDKRSETDIRQWDMQTFCAAQQKQLLDAVMPAHVVYPEVDPLPACFSRRWLTDILRDELGFNGVIFSDDLSMQGAVMMGDFHDRAMSAMEAGCDMVLVCNDRAGAIQVLDKLDHRYAKGNRLESMLKGVSPDMSALQSTDRWRDVQNNLRTFYAD